jgi:hypothetical protein
MQTQNSKMAEFDWAQLPNRVLAIELSLRIVNENTQRAYGLAAAAQEASVRATQKVDSLNITGSRVWKIVFGQSRHRATS